MSGKLINPASMSNGRVQTVQQAIAQLAMRLARYAVAWLVVAISLMGLAQATFWATTQTPLYIGLCVATTIYLALIWLLLRQGQIPELMIHGFMVTAVVWPTLILTFANISLLENWYPTIPLALGVLALGIVILDHDWLTVALVSIMGSWLLFALSVPLSSPWAFHTLVLLATSTLSWTINRAYLTFLTNQMLIRQEAEEQQTLLARRSLQLELGIAVGKGISTMRDLDSLLNEVVALLRENFGFRHVGVFLLDEHNDYIMPRAYHYEGVDGQSLDLDHLKLHVGQEGVVGWAAGQREVVCVNDTLLDWRYVTSENLPHIQAELVVPLLVQGKLLGVLDIQSPERNAFAPDDLEVFQLVADQVAVAIQNVQFFEAEQTARRQAESMRRIGQALTAALEESATQQTIVDELQTLLDVSVAELFMQDAFGKWTRQAYTAVSNFPPLTIGQAITIPDNPANPLHDVLTYARPAMRASFTALRLEALPAEVPVHVWLAVPIVMDEVVQGWVSVCRTTFRPFTAEQIAQASLFAMQAAVALRNAQLYSQLKRYSSQMDYEVHQRTEAIQNAYDELDKLDQAKRDFLSVVSHELRTPLTGLRNYGQMLNRDKAIQANERHARMVDGITTGTVRLQRLVDDMLDMVQIDNRAVELEMVQFSLYILIDYIVVDMEESWQNRQLTLNIAPALQELPLITADFDQLGKVFRHLLSNAIKYTPDGGEIGISGKEWVHDGYPTAVEIVVGDTGIGIAPAEQSLIFSKFHQMGDAAEHSSGQQKFKGGGPGLGLSIAKGIVELHNGEIWVESEGYDEETLPGSRFHIRLPLTSHSTL